MMEKSLTDRFDLNYAEIKKNIAESAKKSGRKYEDIVVLAATKTVDADFEPSEVEEHYIFPISQRFIMDKGRTVHIFNK